MATIYRRGRQWWGRVQRTGKDYRKPLKTAVEAVARKRLAEWLDELERTAWGEKPRHTFDDMALKFIDEHLPTLKPNSRRRYLTSIAALTDHFESLYLDEITSARLSDFADERRRAGTRVAERWIGRRASTAISPSTIRRDLACLSAMFGCATEWEWAEHNPVPAFMKARKKRGLREGDPKTRWLTHDEEASLLAAAEGPLRSAIILAIDTGLRRDELLGLRWDQVNTARNQIELTAKDTKARRAREVPLLSRAGTVIGTIPPRLRSPYVLVNPKTGERYTQLNKGLAAAARRAGIKPLTWHDLRRTCGCRLLQDHAMSMEKVSLWLGHSSVVVTEKAYALLETEHLHAAIGGRTIVGTGTEDSR